MSESITQLRAELETLKARAERAGEQHGISRMKLANYCASKGISEAEARTRDDGNFDILEQEADHLLTKYWQIQSQVLQVTANISVLEFHQESTAVLEKIGENTNAIQQYSQHIADNTDRTEKAVLAGERTAKSVNRLTWVLGGMTLLLLIATIGIAYWTWVLVSHETSRP